MLHYVTISNEMVATQTGRPRDGQIDDAVLRATVELLERDGYLQLTIANVAERAGTTKPAIYRRWPTKAHLVHEAVFPAQAARRRSRRAAICAPTSARSCATASICSAGPPRGRRCPACLAETLGEQFAGGRGARRKPRGTPSRGCRNDWPRASRRARCAPTCSAATVFELVAGAAFVASVSARRRPGRQALDRRRSST